MVRELRAVRGLLCGVFLTKGSTAGKSEALRMSCMSFYNSTGRNSVLKKAPEILWVTPRIHPGWRWISTTRLALCFGAQWGLHARLPWNSRLWLQGVVESNVFCRIFLLQGINFFLMETSFTGEHPRSFYWEYW